MISMQIAALAVALSSGGETTLLDFHAPWCAPCRSMERTIGELERAGYPVRKIDTDRDSALAKQHNVTSIPCFVLLVDGEEAGRLNGAVRRAELLSLFANAGVKPTPAGGTLARAQSPDPPPMAMPGQVDRNPFQAASVHNPRGAVTESSVSMQDLIQASVRLTIEDPQGISHGSGTLIDARHGEALVLTCGHVFRDSHGKGRITVDLFGPQAPQKVPGRLIAYNLKNDVALVSIRPGVPVSVAPVAPAGQRIARGEKVVTVGCNNGGPATALETKITSIDKFAGPSNLQVAGLPVQGRSGGGLFTLDGQVIGVCNAADPADNEGLYAALALIHQELDAAGLASVYQRGATPDARTLAVATAASNQAGLVPRDARAVAAGLAAAGDGLSAAQKAALGAIAARGDNAEVICIVRALGDPRAKSEVITLDRASSAFLRQLAADREAQESRRLTASQVPSRQLDPPSASAPGN
ncbi:MAG TPA: trypsin-like peptidase domain-containing protein [Pirellulales bacterium]|nr:trypsin-like peptidase domain-containing protein [Pirellulales bacterium]